MKNRKKNDECSFVLFAKYFNFRCKIWDYVLLDQISFNLDAYSTIF